jgi:hypothetical protein
MSEAIPSDQDELEGVLILIRRADKGLEEAMAGPVVPFKLVRDFIAFRAERRERAKALGHIFLGDALRRG